VLIKGIEGATQKEIKEIESELKRIASAIQNHRQKSGMSQETLAEVLDVNVNTVKYIEQGRRLPSLPMLIRICNKIGLELTIG
jgi:DNA-binding XRE family transcriptional regulator